MTNREDEIIAAAIGHSTASGATTPNDNTIQDVAGDFVVVCDQPTTNNIQNQLEQQQQQQNNHNNEAVGGGVVAVVVGGGGQLSELWTENPPSSASSGFSDDDSLAGAEGDPKSIEQIVQMVKERGRHGLIQEYAEIRARAPEGTFTNAK